MLQISLCWLFGLKQAIYELINGINVFFSKLAKQIKARGYSLISVNTIWRDLKEFGKIKHVL